MTPHEATRTLVKSPPEVWAQCSEAEALERHLNGSFGEIRITRLEPETAVAWEGEQVRGTVRIEPSAWGTRVTLTAQVEQEQPPPEPIEAPPEPASRLPEPSIDPAPPVLEPPSDPAPPVPEEPSDPAPALTDRLDSTRLWARLTRRFRAAPPPPEPAGPPPAPPSVAPPPPVAQATAPAARDEAPPVAQHEPPPVAQDEVRDELRDEVPPNPDPVEILNAALDSLGQAHHRPFSRA